jgi:hypothetical protein
MKKQGAKELMVVKNLREYQHQFKTPSLSGSLSEEETTFMFLVPSLGSIGRSRGGGHTKVDFPIANATR